ncbi:MAG: hypothetical protein KHW37_07340, partial [Collinsella intestinalis]|nr:hypothetical protein [Collinsella intestinalis]
MINALLVGQVPAPLWAQEALAGDVTAEASDESVPSAEVAPDVVVERVSSDATEPATAVEESNQVSDGDVIELAYEDDSGAVLPEQDIAIDPAAPRPDWESSWPSFTTSNKP